MTVKDSDTDIAEMSKNILIKMKKKIDAISFYSPLHGAGTSGSETLIPFPVILEGRRGGTTPRASQYFYRKAFPLPGICADALSPQCKAVKSVISTLRKVVGAGELSSSDSDQNRFFYNLTSYNLTCILVWVSFKKFAYISRCCTIAPVTEWWPPPPPVSVPSECPH